MQRAYASDDLGVYRWAEAETPPRLTIMTADGSGCALTRHIQIKRLNLHGGKQGAVTLPPGPAADRIREYVTTALENCTQIDDVPMPAGGNNIVEATIPDLQDPLLVLVVRVADKADVMEVTSGENGGSPKSYHVGVQECTKVQRMLLTEFLLKDSLGGHQPSSFKFVEVTEKDN